MEKQDAPTNGEIERVSATRTYIPAVDIFQDKDKVTLYFDMPGVDQNSLDILLEKSTLTIEGRVSSDAPEDTGLIRQEYGIGDFHRSFQLNDEYDHDKIEATIKHGVLKVVLPRITPTRKKIQVQAG